ncbi:MAG TPA: class I SAM-dependent methyltransferase [Actinomycetota bacterium]|nr:class I SAM-dependent methyltransferase [Actinomycetota bacterium]
MTTPRLYDEFAPWWHVMSAPAEYEEEASLYARAFREHARKPVRTVLEIGSGGGNNASHLKRGFTMTLVDRSPDMLAQSRFVNPECEHLEGDMRTLHLGRTFDAVFIHDAIMYMTTEDDLRAVFATAFAHLDEGGMALFVPDRTAENYVPTTSSGGHDTPERSMRYLQWEHPAHGQTILTSFVYAFREGSNPVRIEYDEHQMGLFSRDVWLAGIADAGFEARAIPYEHSDFEGAPAREMFVGLC